MSNSRALHPFEVILLLVENEQQCTKWFILEFYRQPNIIFFGGGSQYLAMLILSRAHMTSASCHNDVPRL